MQYSLFRIKVSYVTHIHPPHLPPALSCLFIADRKKTFQFLLAFIPQDITLIDIFNSRDAFHQFNISFLLFSMPHTHFYIYEIRINTNE